MDKLLENLRAAIIAVRGNVSDLFAPLSVLKGNFFSRDQLALVLNRKIAVVKAGETWTKVEFGNVPCIPVSSEETVAFADSLTAIPEWLAPEIDTILAGLERSWPNLFAKRAGSCPTEDQRKRFEDRLSFLEKTIREANRGTEEPADPEFEKRAKKLSAVLGKIKSHTDVDPETWVKLLEAAGIDSALIRASVMFSSNRRWAVVQALRFFFKTSTPEPALVLGGGWLAFLDWKDGIPVWKEEQHPGRHRPGTAEDVERIIAGIDGFPTEWLQDK